ncbi:MAG: DapH/DapD/GlmU-related protein [Candidatus Paceibacterota bacterium]|jgi:acetyltransferase-like isoleucine patch superfamily enzyme
MSVYPGAKVLERTVIIAEDEKWFIGDFCLVTVPKLMIGSGSQINAGTKVLGRELVSIGRRSVVSYDCLLLTSSDTPNPTEWKHNDFSPEDERRIKSQSIVIGDDCFIGAKCVLMPGVCVPMKTVIPAGSYVYMKQGEHYYRPLGEVSK